MCVCVCVCVYVCVCARALHIKFPFSTSLRFWQYNRWTSKTVLHNFVSFLVFNIEKLIVWSISAKRNYYNVTKTNDKFQAGVTGRCTSLSNSSGIFRQDPFKIPFKTLWNNNFTIHELIHKWLLRFPVTFLFIYL